MPGLLLYPGNARVLVCVRVACLLKRLWRGLNLPPGTFANTALCATVLFCRHGGEIRAATCAAFMRGLRCGGVPFAVIRMLLMPAA